MFASFSECGTENSGCAGNPRLWHGRVFAPNGAPAERASVLFYFESVQPSQGPQTPIRAGTDRGGRYCLRWPAEKSLATIRAQITRAAARPDPRLVGHAGQATESIIITPDPVGGAFVLHTRQPASLVLSALWEPGTDQTRRCVEHNPPWYRRQGLLGNWRSLLLIALGLLALALGVVARIAPGGEVARNVARIAGTTALAGAALFVLVWFTKTV